MDNDNTFGLWDRIWGAISKNEKELAVTCHELQDIKTDVKENRAFIAKLEGKYDELIQRRIQESRYKADRSANIKIALMGGMFGILTVLLQIYIK